MAKTKRPAPTDEEVKKAILVILSDKNAYSTSLNYAVGYCQNALRLFGDSLHTQVLYILNNITHWRHAEAKNVRDVLKAYKGGK